VSSKRRPRCFHFVSDSSDHSESQGSPALAAKVGLHRNFIGMIERGEQNVTLLSLEAIADVLRVSVGELVTAAGTRRTRWFTTPIRIQCFSRSRCQFLRNQAHPQLAELRIIRNGSHRARRLRRKSF
jgi:transcriptional regulator with XRE-family HTH domain